MSKTYVRCPECDSDIDPKDVVSMRMRQIGGDKKLSISTEKNETLLLRLFGEKMQYEKY